MEQVRFFSAAALLTSCHCFQEPDPQLKQRVACIGTTQAASVDRRMLHAQ
jgi:hypothetical protein